MLFADVYKVYVCVPKLRVPKFYKYIKESRIDFVHPIGKPKVRETNFYQMVPYLAPYTNKPMVRLMLVPVEAVPESAVVLMIHRLKDYKAFFAIQGFDLTLPTF